MRKVGSGQRSFVFADSPPGGDGVAAWDGSEAKAWLPLRAKDKDTQDLTAQTGNGSTSPNGSYPNS